jgi:transcriptional regulator with XRE-family HTH domain
LTISYRKGVMSAAPLARRRLVGAALRRYREAIGYDLADAARVLACDRSKMSRIESGERGIRAAELQALLREYGVSASAQEALAALSRPLEGRGWWQEPGVVVADGMKDFAAIEALASSILVYEAHRVPDLLQTADYARALITAAGVADREDARDRMLAAVLARQRAVLRDADPDGRPRITVVIAEAALLNVVGGLRVARTQLDSLARASSGSEHLTIHVLPLTRGTQAAAAGSMTIVGVGGVPALGAVHVPGVRGGICLPDASDVAAYTRAFEQLRVYALNPAASARFLRDLAAKRALRAS